MVTKSKIIVATLVLSLIFALNAVFSVSAMPEAQHALVMALSSGGGGIQSGGSYQLASSINSHAATVSGGPYRINLGILISPPKSYQLYLPWINQ